MSSHHIGSEPLSYTHCLRVTVTVDGDGATITDVRRVAMRAPASAPGSPVADQSGMWFELRSDEGEVLYHRALRTPHLDSVEVFDDEETGAIRRVPTSVERAKFDLIVPDLADAAHMDLYGASDTAEKHLPAVLLLRAPIQQLRGEGPAEQS
jgi:hypothetical protein